MSSWTPKWWKEATIYQIYPSTFLDSNGDGIGDIPGILQKLDYLQDLGVDVVWLSPHYKSPQVDMGYDISDYKDIYEKYGTLEQCLTLIKECHKRSIKIIFDLVINHTSDQHDWFIESKSSKDSPKRDWYIWRPAQYDKQGNRHPPNNWRSFFNGSAWTWDEKTEEYYLHLFTPEQPDLNWRNPITRDHIYQDSMLFWLEHGVDGFRIDVVELYSKPEDLHDAPVTEPASPWQNCGPVVIDAPMLHEYLGEMYSKAFGKYDCMTVGEGGGGSFEKALTFVGASRKELNMAFQMGTTGVGVNHEQLLLKGYKLTEFKESVEKWQHLMDGTDGWTTVFIENHDNPRSISRFGSEETPELLFASGKLLSIMLVTLSGTLFLYQGQEIGMINMPKSWPLEEYKDVATVNRVAEIKQKTANDPKALYEALKFYQVAARDHARTPMQWSNEVHGGFSTGEPWMRANPSYSFINAESQEQDPESLLSFWKAMLKLRKDHKLCTVYGEFRPIDHNNEQVFAYTKTGSTGAIAVSLNFTKEHQVFNLAEKLNLEFNQIELLVSSSLQNTEGELQPFEGTIHKIHYRK
jgi:oligo-1,6-glucosidase